MSFFLIICAVLVYAIRYNESLFTIGATGDQNSSPALNVGCMYSFVLFSTFLHFVLKYTSLFVVVKYNTTLFVKCVRSFHFVFRFCPSILSLDFVLGVRVNFGSISIDRSAPFPLQVLAAMQRQQAAFLESMESELNSEEDEDMGDDTQQEERSLECVMCREKSSKSNPLGQVRNNLEVHFSSSPEKNIFRTSPE